MHFYEIWGRGMQNSGGLFSTLSEIFKAHNNENILPYNTANLKEKVMGLPRNGWAGCILSHRL